MHLLTAAELLDVWERGQNRKPYEQALLLLHAAYPGSEEAVLEEWSIGRRDAHLLTLREWLFEEALTSVADCPRCGERLELNFTASDIRAEPGEEPGEANPEGTFSCRVAGYDLTLRPPSTGDLKALDRAGGDTPARRWLLGRCLIRGNRGGEEAVAESLPEEAVREAWARIAEADPQAEVHLNVACSACGHAWALLFDIVSYLWAELDAWAGRILGEVHLLAKAYGWGEAEILALSPRRRRFYLDKVSG